MVLVYGLENLVDFLSDAVVLWRFFAPTTVDESLERKLRHREKRANVAISLIMIALGFLVMLASFIDLLNGDDSIEQKAAIFGLAFFSMPSLGVLAWLKIRYGRLIDSPSLSKDGVVSLIGFVLAVSLFIDTLFEVKFESLWFFDPVAAFIAGAVSTFLGVQGLHAAQREGIPVFDRQWWVSGNSNGGTDNDGGVEMPNGTRTNGEKADLTVEPLDDDDKQVV